jgi:hypothetical protein
MEPHTGAGTIYARLGRKPSQRGSVGMTASFVPGAVQIEGVRKNDDQSRYVYENKENIDKMSRKKSDI